MTAPSISPTAPQPTPVPSQVIAPAEMPTETTEQQVARLHEALRALGYQIEQKEREERALGDSTVAALAELKKLGAGNPVMFAIFKQFMSDILGIDLDEVCEADGSVGGGVGGGRGGSHVLRAPAREGATKANLEAIMAVTPHRGLQGAANLANAYVGFRETGNNGGPLVAFVGGADGLPWCGDFTRFITDAAYPGLFDQANFKLANSFMEVGKKSNSFHSGRERPHVGDVVNFSRGKPGSGQGHVGIVTSVAEDGTVTYVSGNMCDAVTPATYNYKTGQHTDGLLGFTDVAQLARAKGKEHLLQPQEPVIALASPTKAMASNRAAYERG